MGIIIGGTARSFDLPGTDGMNHSLEEYSKKLLAIIFTCNHCPYAQAFEDRIIAIQKDYPDILQIVAINPNDQLGYPEDDFDSMVVRAREKGFNFPYLRDEPQQVAKAYGPVVTPDVFLFDEKRFLRYRGRIDDNWQDPEKVKSQDFRRAIDELSQGKEPTVKEANSIGCSIKWKAENF